MTALALAWQMDARTERRIANMPRWGDLPVLFTSYRNAAGVPDFRINDPEKTWIAFRDHKCAICGEGQDDYMVFVAGPHVVKERATPEPPTHYGCVRFALTICPYLMRSRARSERARPEGTITDVYHAPTLPEEAYLAWSRSYKLTMVNGIVYALVTPWKRLERF